MKYNEFRRDVEERELVYHHSSLRRGYVSRVKDLGCGFGNGKLVDYKGRFGEGIIHITPCNSSTQYVHYDYYIKPFESKD